MSAFFNTGLSQQQFLDQYWQKKPLLIRQAFPNFKAPVSAEELAGLACEADIESRLIEEQGQNGPWQLRYGPFSEQDFAALPSTHWTLLVQDVDKHLPQTRSLLTPFRFIPDWRRDDLMISYAPEYGSVGPHTDGYDVFLLQAMGTRRWQIANKPVENPALIAGLDLKILTEFSPDQSWDLEPGDMLYLPPHFAHHGVALNDCMTYSIGFRAPTQAELLDAFINTLLEHEQGTAHYSDATLNVSENDGEIDNDALTRFKLFLHQTIDEASPLIATAVGKLLTETKSSLEELATERVTERPEVAELAQRLSQSETLLRNRYYRLAWHADEDSAQLFVAGEAFSLPVTCKNLLPLFSEADELCAEHWQLISRHEPATALLATLIEEGVWYWSE